MRARTDRRRICLEGGALETNAHTQKAPHAAHFVDHSTSVLHFLLPRESDQLARGTQVTPRDQLNAAAGSRDSVTRNGASRRLGSRNLCPLVKRDDSWSLLSDVSTPCGRHTRGARGSDCDSCGARSGLRGAAVVAAAAAAGDGCASQLRSRRVYRSSCSPAARTTQSEV